MTEGAGRRIDDATRARIVELGRGGMPRNAIARELRVGRGTVTRACNTADPPVVFDRAQTAEATAAHLMDLRAERERLGERLLVEANAALDQLHAEHIVSGWYQGTASEHRLARPTSGDVKNYMLAAAIALDKHVTIHQIDGNDRDASAVDLFLTHTMGGNTA